MKLERIAEEHGGYRSKGSNGLSLTGHETLWFEPGRVRCEVHRGKVQRVILDSVAGLSVDDLRTPGEKYAFTLAQHIYDTLDIAGNVTVPKTGFPERSDSILVADIVNSVLVKYLPMVDAISENIYRQIVTVDPGFFRKDHVVMKWEEAEKVRPLVVRMAPRVLASTHSDFNVGELVDTQAMDFNDAVGDIVNNGYNVVLSVPNVSRDWVIGKETLGSEPCHDLTIYQQKGNTAVPLYTHGSESTNDALNGLNAINRAIRTNRTLAYTQDKNQRLVGVDRGWKLIN